MDKNVQNRNTIYNTIKSVFSVIHPIITFPYISRVLMTDNVGKISYGNSIVSYFALLASLGVKTYAIRECSKVRGDRSRLGRIASEILSINIVSTLISYFGLAILLLFAKPLESYRILICVQSATILFTTMGADWINTAMEDFRYLAIRTMLFQVLSLLLMFVFVHRPEHYMRYALIAVVSSSGANIANILYRRRFCTIRFTWKMNARKHLPSILLLFSLILSQTIYVNSDMTILGLIKGDHEVGLYSTAVKIYQIVNTTIASIAWVVMPKLSAYFAVGNYTEINRLLKYALNFILVLGIPSICGLEIIAPHLIGTIAGEAYIDAAPALRILGVAMLCSFIGGWIGNMTRLPAGRESISLRISMISASINIILNLIMIPKWGMYAAAFTTAVSECFGMTCGLVLLDRKIRIEGIGKMLIGPLIGGAGIVAIGAIIQRALDQYWLVSCVTIVISMAWYLIVMCATKNEFFFGFVKPVLNRFRGGDGEI